jgi:polyferredoxin
LAAKKSTPARNRNSSGSAARRWLAARKITQGLALLAFLALFVMAQRGGWPASLANASMRLDPLLILAHLLASRTFLAGSTLALIVFILGLVAGRAWCGWLCPLGTILDLFPAKWRFDRHLSRDERPAFPPESWRSLKYGLLLVILVAALLGNLTLLVLDPITILFRSVTTGLWPVFDRLVTAAETGLYNLPVLSGPVAAFDGMIRPSILPAEPIYARQLGLYVLVFMGVIGLNLLAPRFWCRYLCPLGGLLGLVAKVALLRRVVSPDCKGCGLCTPSCPTGTIDPGQDYASDPGECTLCLECLESCPRSLITVTPGFAPAVWKEYNPGRRQALLAIGATLGGLAVLAGDASSHQEHGHHLLPPGGRESDLLSVCLRCGACMRACPTGGLQPALSEAGLAGLWTPVLLPRLGYCDYSCNACGQVCPVQAIPPLSLDEKRLQVIGKATIDKDRCIAWGEHRDCIVCEEMCPLPEKAIQLEQEELPGPDGNLVSVQLPSVLKERCIGCGICEYKCPVSGPAAIQVYIPGETI